ncbi:MAG: pyridoxal phosphate-dependent aminotransferase [Kiloniellales bacterium]|nr:pyridoxal phosphate-dependent aminotransferase [Kiloniellales bacterium]
MPHAAAAMARLGTETAFDVLARAAALQAAGKSVINLGIGQPDFKTPENIVEAGVKALRDGHHGYTPAMGLLPLREAVCADLARRHGVEVSPERVLILPGGKVTMFFAVLMFGEPAAEILYPNPGFPIYESVINYSGAKAVPIPLREADGFALSADQVLDLVTPRTRLIILNSPANPTGGVTPPQEIDKLVEGLARFPDAVILSDEIYSQMLYDGRQHRSLLDYPELSERVILLDGWSKTYAMTGWRLGFSVWPEALIEGATRLAVNCHSCVNAATQFAGIEALQGPQDSVERMVAAFAERRAVVLRELNQIPGFRCVEPGGAFYAFPNIGETGLSAKALETGLLEQAGVATIAGTSFGAMGEGFLRLSYANSLENIEAAMVRIRQFLAARRDDGIAGQA